MTWSAYILEHKQELEMILMGVLLLCAKLPVVEHNTMLDAILQALIKRVKGDVEQAPVVITPVDTTKK